MAFKAGSAWTGNANSRPKGARDKANKDDIEALKAEIAELQAARAEDAKMLAQVLTQLKEAQTKPPSWLDANCSPRSFLLAATRNRAPPPTLFCNWIPANRSRSSPHRSKQHSASRCTVLATGSPLVGFFHARGFSIVSRFRCGRAGDGRTQAPQNPQARSFQRDFARPGFSTGTKPGMD